MKFAVSRDLLLRPLQLVSGVVERRQTLPILANLLLEVEGDTLTVTGTDLEVQLIARIPLPNAAESDGKITIPAWKLVSIWRALPEDADVKFALENQRAVLRSGRSRFQLATLPPDEFPSIEEGDSELRLELAQEQWRQLIKRTEFAMAQQDVRYYLNGLLLEVQASHVRAVATDGHRLAVCTKQPGAGDECRQVIIPRKGVQELSKLLSEGDDVVSLVLGKHHLRADIGAYTFVTKLVDGKFPDYERVIPQDGTRIMLGERRLLHEALQRTAILANEKYRSIRLSFAEKSLTVLADNPEQEEAEESIPVEFDAEPLEIGFNVDYLIDVLRIMESEKVKITLSDENSSVLMENPEGSDSVYVIMPLRL